MSVLLLLFTLSVIISYLLLSLLLLRKYNTQIPSFHVISSYAQRVFLSETKLN